MATTDSALGPLGILGGGQLGRMTAQAATDLGVDVVIAEKHGRSPAARVAAAEVVFDGTWGDETALARLAERAPIITLENEFVDAGVLRRLEALGSLVLPGPDAVGTVQDKLLQKTALAEAGLALPPFAAVESAADVMRLAERLGWPLVVKARRDGYDGYGNRLVRAAEAVPEALASLGAPARALYVEGFVRFERELAVIVVRGREGECVTYPVVESRQHPERQVCEVVLAPGDVPAAVAEAADETALRAVEAVGGVGTFGVELFLIPDGAVLVNELAPRPHNSGHYSIEACVTSQFANHVRAVLGLPLGDPSLRAPAAAMVNLLGTGGPPPDRAAFARALVEADAFVHLYG